jgi:hypothetical protein
VILGAVFCKTEAQDGVEKKVPRLASRETRGWLRDFATSRASAWLLLCQSHGGNRDLGQLEFTIRCCTVLIN